MSDKLEQAKIELRNINEMADIKRVEKFKSCLERVGYTVGINKRETQEER